MVLTRGWCVICLETEEGPPCVMHKPSINSLGRLLSGTQWHLGELINAQECPSGAGIYMSARA